MSTTNKIIIPNSLKKDIKKYAENIAKSMAKSVRDDMKKEYLYVIEKFYAEYTPKYYFRWDELWNTYEPYYHNSSPNFYGGIILTANGMTESLYHNRNSAYTSFLNGYHGHPSLGIYSKIRPYEHMIRYRDNIISHIDIYNTKAINEARKASYSILQF